MSTPRSSASASLAAKRSWKSGLDQAFRHGAKGSGLKRRARKGDRDGRDLPAAGSFSTDPTARVRTKTPRVGRDPMISEDGAIRSRRQLHHPLRILASGLNSSSFRRQRDARAAVDFCAVGKRNPQIMET
jgi:hypothetical protein